MPPALSDALARYSAALAAWERAAWRGTRAEMARAQEELSQAGAEYLTIPLNQGVPNASR